MRLLEVNKGQNHYYYNIFFKKCFHQLPKNDDKKKFLYKIQVLYYDRSDASETIDVNKISKLYNIMKKYDIFHHWYFLDKRFKFQLMSAVEVMMS